MVIGLGEGTLVVAVAQLYFRIPLTGSLWLLYAAMTLYLLAMPAADVLHSLWPLAILAAVTLSAATWLCRRRAE
jgi:hypothetical protein